MHVFCTGVTHSGAERPPEKTPLVLLSSSRIFPQQTALDFPTALHSPEWRPYQQASSFTPPSYSDVTYVYVQKTHESSVLAPMTLPSDVDEPRNFPRACRRCSNVRIYRVV